MHAQVDVPLGADDDNDGFPPPNQLSTAHPAAKVAGAHRSTPASTSKQKGKAKAVPENHKRKRGGYLSGTANYTDADMEQLLQIVLDLLPIGGKGWKLVEDDYNAWAKSNGRPVQTVASLENKYKTVCFQ